MGCSGSAPSLVNPAPFCADVCCGKDCLGTDGTNCTVIAGSNACVNALLQTNCSSLGMGVSCTTTSQAQSVCANLFASPSVAVYLDEFSINKDTGVLTLVQSIPYPVVAKDSGLNGLPNRRCTNSGQATAESQITISEDNNYIVHTCYDAPVGVLNIPKTVAARVPRVIARVNMNGIVDTSISLGSFFAPAAVNSSATVARRDGIPRGSSDTTSRAAASFDGQSFWAVGTANGVVFAGYYRNATSGKFDLQTVTDTINGQSTSSGANLRGVQIENCNVFGVSAPAPTNQTYPKFLYSMSSGPISGFNIGNLPSKTTNTGLQLYPLSPGIGRYFSGTGNNIWNSQTSPYDFEFQPSTTPGAPPLLWLCDDSSNVQYGTTQWGGLYLFEWNASSSKWDNTLWYNGFTTGTDCTTAGCGCRSVTARFEFNQYVLYVTNSAFLGQPSQIWKVQIQGTGSQRSLSARMVYQTPGTSTIRGLVTLDPESPTATCGFAPSPAASPTPVPKTGGAASVAVSFASLAILAVTLVTNLY
jgi:hypothetical protein